MRKQSTIYPNSYIVFKVSNKDLIRDIIIWKSYLFEDPLAG